MPANFQPLRLVDVRIIQKEAAMHGSAPIIRWRALYPGKAERNAWGSYQCRASRHETPSIYFHNSLPHLYR